jgi:hypothetical protein
MNHLMIALLSPIVFGVSGLNLLSIGVCVLDGMHVIGVGALNRL